MLHRRPQTSTPCVSWRLLASCLLIQLLLSTALLAAAPYTHGDDPSTADLSTAGTAAAHDDPFTTGAVTAAPAHITASPVTEDASAFGSTAAAASADGAAATTGAAVSAGAAASAYGAAASAGGAAAGAASDGATSSAGALLLTDLFHQGPAVRGPAKQRWHDAILANQFPSDCSSRPLCACVLRAHGQLFSKLRGEASCLLHAVLSNCTLVEVRFDKDLTDTRPLDHTSCLYPTDNLAFAPLCPTRRLHDCYFAPLSNCSCDSAGPSTTTRPVGTTSSTTPHQGAHTPPPGVLPRWGREEPPLRNGTPEGDPAVEAPPDGTLPHPPLTPTPTPTGGPATTTTTTTTTFTAPPTPTLSGLVVFEVMRPGLSGEMAAEVAARWGLRGTLAVFSEATSFLLRPGPVLRDYIPRVAGWLGLAVGLVSPPGPHDPSRRNLRPQHPGRHEHGPHPGTDSPARHPGSNNSPGSHPGRGTWQRAGRLRGGGDGGDDGGGGDDGLDDGVAGLLPHSLGGGGGGARGGNRDIDGGGSHLGVLGGGDHGVAASGPVPPWMAGPPGGRHFNNDVIAASDRRADRRRQYARGALPRSPHPGGGPGNINNGNSGSANSNGTAPWPGSDAAAAQHWAQDQGSRGRRELREVHRASSKQVEALSRRSREEGAAGSADGRRVPSPHGPITGAGLMGRSQRNDANIFRFTSFPSFGAGRGRRSRELKWGGSGSMAHFSLPRRHNNGKSSIRAGAAGSMHSRGDVGVGETIAVHIRHGDERNAGRGAGDTYRFAEYANAVGGMLGLDVAHVMSDDVHAARDFAHVFFGRVVALGEDKVAYARVGGEMGSQAIRKYYRKNNVLMNKQQTNETRRGRRNGSFSSLDSLNFTGSIENGHSISTRAADRSITGGEVEGPIVDPTVDQVALLLAEVVLMAQAGAIIGAALSNVYSTVVELAAMVTWPPPVYEIFNDVMSFDGIATGFRPHNDWTLPGGKRTGCLPGDMDWHPCFP
eukprot:jgi/Mesvir1/19861/Mv13151-RA.1